MFLKIFLPIGFNLTFTKSPKPTTSLSPYKIAVGAALIAGAVIAVVASGGTALAGVGAAGGALAGGTVLAWLNLAIDFYFIY